MFGKRLGSTVIVGLLIATALCSVVPSALGGQTSFKEEFDNTTYKKTASTVAGWGIGEVSLPRVPPKLLGSYSALNTAYKFAIQGNFAYVGSWSSTDLTILNITDVSKPTLAGSFVGSGFGYGEAIDGNVAYVSDWNSLKSVNVTNPASPTQISSLTGGATLYSLQAQGDWLFGARWSGGVYAINISNPAAMGPIYTRATTGSSYGLDILGDMAYVADYSRVSIVNVSKPWSMSLVTTITPAKGSYIYSTEVQGNTLYVLTSELDMSGVKPSNYYVYSYDVSNPAKPVYLDNVSITGRTTWSYGMDLEEDGDYLYISAYADGIYIVNISNPADLRYTESFFDTPGSAYMSMKRGMELFVSDYTAGIEIYNVSDIITPKSASTYDSPGSAYKVFVEGNYAYVADDASGLRIVNITDPKNMKSAGTLDTAGNSYGIWVSDGYAYLPDDNLVRIINVSAPANPKQYGTFDNPGNAYDIMVLHKVAFLADFSQGLRIFNVTNPTAPGPIGAYDTAGNANAVWVQGNVAYVADGNNGLVAVNIQNLASPTLLGTFDTSGSAVDVQVDGNIAYVADSGGGLVVLNVTNPWAMKQIASYDTAGSAQGVFVSGNWVFVADDDDGLRVFNVTNPWSIKYFGALGTLADAWGVMVSGEYAYVTNRGNGLVSVQVFENIAESYKSLGTAESITIDTTPYLIVAINVSVNETKPGGTKIFYNATNDGGATWMRISPGTLKRFPAYASDLRWKANLTTSDVKKSPSIQNVTVTYYYDDVLPKSDATNGAPQYDNEGTIPVKWTAKDPFPDTGIKTVVLWFRYDSNSDGDFTDLGDIAWTLATLPTETGSSGTYYFNPEGNDGTYEFYTIATDNASWVEAPPAQADDSTVFDSVRPTSNCFGGSPAYENGGTITVWYNASDPAPGSGINNVSLYYRLDTTNDGDFTDVGDTDWVDSGATVQTATQGSFSFNPKGKDGRYEFFTLATDKATNVERYPPVRQSFTIYDSHPPITTAYIGGTATASGWYVGSVYIFLNAEDAISGVNKTKFRVDGGQWNVYMQPILINSDGKHTVDFYSEDRAGNKETDLQVKIDIDNSAPETDYTLSGTVGNNGWYTSDVTLTFTAKDDFSGLNKTKYRVNGGGWKLYTAPVMLSDDGAFAINYYSVDNANNNEERGDLQVFVDRTPPAITHTLVGNPAANGAFPASVTAIITASDPTSGLASVEYKLDNGTWSPYSEALVISNEGNHTLQYRAKDVAGNMATSAVVNIVLDLTPPTVAIALTGPQHGGWYNSTVTVTVTASDGENAVGQVQVSLDRGPWTNYTAAIKMSDPGDHTVEARAVDLVGHESEVASASFKVDTKAPVTAKTVAGTMGKNGWYISDVQIILTPGDDLSGVASTAYRINGGAWTTYTEPVAMSTDGTYSFEYSATDLAGNTEVMKGVIVNVDKTPPTITFTSHKDGQKVSTAIVTLVGKTDPKATLKINDVAVTVSADGTFTKAVTLVEGENTIKAVAEDLAGHVTASGISLMKDSTPPTVLIYTPLDGIRTSDTSVVVQGSTEPGTNVTVNGELVTVDANGGFSKTVNLDIGTKTLTIKVTDPLGNSVEQSRSVTREKAKTAVHETSASDVMPAFLLALVLVAVLVALLGYFMGKRNAPPKDRMEEPAPAPEATPQETPRPRRVVRSAGPPPGPPGSEEGGGNLGSLEGQSEFGASETDWKRT